MMVTVCALVIPVSKPRNWIAKDLRTPKYRCRVELNKKKYKRKEKHREQSD
jgi:stalled ribosome alternative rescue factor ArfA